MALLEGGSQLEGVGHWGHIFEGSILFQAPSHGSLLSDCRVVAHFTPTVLLALMFRLTLCIPTSNEAKCHWLKPGAEISLVSCFLWLFCPTD